jgi:hypothetical protein
MRITPHHFWPLKRSSIGRRRTQFELLLKRSERTFIATCTTLRSMRSLGAQLKTLLRVKHHPMDVRWAALACSLSRKSLRTILTNNAAMKEHGRPVRISHIAIPFFAFVFGLSSTAAIAESTLHVDVEAASLDVDGHRVSLLVKVTDNSPDKDSSGRITTSLPPPGSCSPSFKDDVQFVVGSCFAVQLWDTGIRVERVKVRVLDAQGASDYAVLTWNSRSTLPIVQRSVKLVVGVANGWYSDNPDTQFVLSDAPSFNPSRPYAFLLQRDDRALNLAYRYAISSFDGNDEDKEKASLRTEERIWVRRKESDCREADDPDRCRWLATVDRLDAISADGQK